MQSSLYETDFYAWTLEQSQFLQTRQLDALDLVHLAEEIADLGRQERRELENCLAILLGHLLKWDHQPERRGKSWKATIREQRRSTQNLLRQNPSLKAYLPKAIAEAYQSGIDFVVRETPLDYPELPPECPYTVEQIFDVGFPESIT